jgi:hypothetical protein
LSARPCIITRSPAPPAPPAHALALRAHAPGTPSLQAQLRKTPRRRVPGCVREDRAGDSRAASLARSAAGA